MDCEVAGRKIAFRKTIAKPICKGEYLTLREVWKPVMQSYGNFCVGGFLRLLPELLARRRLSYPTG